MRTLFSVDVKLAWLTLTSHRRRFLLLGSAITLVASLAMFMTSVSAGIHETLLRGGLALSTGHLNVTGYFKPTVSTVTPVMVESSKVEEAIHKILPEAQLILSRGRHWARIISEKDSMQLSLNGVDVAHESLLESSLQLSSGSFAGLSQRNAILLFRDQAEKLAVNTGDTITVSAQTSRGVANTMDCRVVAVANNVGVLSRWTAFLSNESLRSLYQLGEDTAGVLQIHLPPDKRAESDQLALRLRNGLVEQGYLLEPASPSPYWEKIEDAKRAGWTGQHLDVTSWRQELSFMMWTVQTIDGLNAVVLMLLLGIVAVGITNTLWIAIRERTNEIGTLRAIGMQRGAIVRMFMTEAVLLGLISSALSGALVALALAWVNSCHIELPLSMQVFLMSSRLELPIGWTELAGPGLVMVLFAALAALYPALRAARLEPRDAMSRTV